MFGFNDDDEDVGGFPGSPQQGPTFTAGGQPLGYFSNPDNRQHLGMMLAALAGLYSPDGKSAALQNIQAMSAMQANQQKNAYQQAMVALKQQQAASEADYQKGMGEVFGGTSTPVVTPTDAGAEQAPKATPNPMMARAEQYRRASEFAARTGRDEAAKRYADIADGIEKQAQGEWSLPQTMLGPDGKTIAVQFNTKTGETRAVNGMAPKGNYTAPVASADGMISVNQDTGDVSKLGVGAHEPTPAEIQAYQLAQQQGFKGTILDFQKAKAAAGAARVSTEVKVGNTMGEELAREMGKHVMTGMVGAEAAASTNATIDQVMGQLNQAIVGPMADTRVAIARGMNAMGFGGTELGKRLAATAEVAQGLAKTSLDSAAKMYGQGQISNAERDLIAKASSGAMNMSVPELRAAMAAVKKVNDLSIKTFQANANSVKSIPQFNGVLGPFFDNSPAMKYTPSAPPRREASGPVQEAPAPAQKQVRRTGKTKDGRTVVEYTDGTREYR